MIFSWEFPRGRELAKPPHEGCDRLSMMILCALGLEIGIDIAAYSEAYIREWRPIRMTPDQIDIVVDGYPVLSLK